MIDCDLRINDMSVSRSHAILKLIGDNIYLDDIGSKFGTLANVEDDLKLLPNIPFTVQVGSKVVTLLSKFPYCPEESISYKDSKEVDAPLKIPIRV